MNKSRIKAVLLLPVNAVIVIPALILLFSQQQVGLAFNLLSFVGLAVWCGGLGLVWLAGGSLGLPDAGGLAGGQRRRRETGRVEQQKASGGCLA